MLCSYVSSVNEEAVEGGNCTGGCKFSSRRGSSVMSCRFFHGLASNAIGASPILFSARTNCCRCLKDSIR